MESNVDGFGKKRRKLSFSNIFPEDLEEEQITVNLGPDGKLNDDDLLSYLSVYFSDEIYAQDCRNRLAVTTPELNRIGSRVTWVESIQTGELIPVARRIVNSGKLDEANLIDDANENAGDLEEGVSDDEDDIEFAPLIPPPEPLVDSTNDRKKKFNETEVTKSITSYNNLVMLQRGIFLFFQGLLAGFAFTTLYIRQATNDDDSKLLTYYQPNAQEYRRYFYILCTIALVGSIDLLLTIVYSRSDHMQYRRQHSQSHSNYYRALYFMKINYDSFSLLLVLFITILHGVAFICTILMSAQDTLIYNKYQLTVSSDIVNWTTRALDDKHFVNGLEDWKSLDRARLVCAVLAWIGCCVFVWKDLTQLNSKSEDLYKMRESAMSWTRRVQTMEGDPDRLDDLTPAELKRLLTILEGGTSRVRDAYGIYEQQVEGNNNGVTAVADTDISKLDISNLINDNASAVFSNKNL